MNNSRGLGIIELLYTILIISVIAAIILLVLPSQKDNRQQLRDIKTLTSAIENYATDNKGQLPKGITEVPTEICKIHAEDCTGLVDLTVLTINEKYLTSLPINPHTESANGTGYSVKKDATGKVVVTVAFKL
jgi:type II secretory pathway pseudopilin PulG